MALHDGSDSVFLELSEYITSELYVNVNDVKFNEVISRLVKGVVGLFTADVPVFANLKQWIAENVVNMMTMVIGDPSSNDFVRHSVMLSTFLSTYVIAEIVNSVGAEKLGVSDDEARVLRHEKLEAARELSSSSYSIFVPGFLGRLRSACEVDVVVKVPLGEEIPVKRERPERVQRAKSTVTATTPVKVDDEDGDNMMNYDYVYSIKELNTVLKEVDRLPLSSIFTGLTDTRSLSAFRNETETLAKLRHWSPAHSFHYLSRVISPEVWQLVCPDIDDELSSNCYSMAINQLWLNLVQLCGGVVEDEKMLDQLLGLVQGDKENVLQFLGRITTYREQCRNSNMPYDDSFFIMVSRRGLRSTDLASQTAAVVTTQWNDWVRTVAMLDRRNKVDNQKPDSVPTDKVIDLTAPERGNGTPSTSSGTPDKSSVRVRRCYNCGKTGHVSRNCPDKGPRKCWNCGELGHLSSSCPKRNESSVDQERDKVEQINSKRVQVADNGSNSGVATTTTTTSGTIETVILPSRTVKLYEEADSAKQEDIGGALLTASWEDVSIRGLVDTGAADALMSYEKYCELQAHCAAVVKLEKTTASIQLADGGIRVAMGTVTLALRFGNGASIVYPFYVVQSLCPSVIWGVKLLAKLGISITVDECPQGVRISTAFIAKDTEYEVQNDVSISQEEMPSPDILAVRSCGDSYAVVDSIEALVSGGSLDPQSEVETYSLNTDENEPDCETYVFDWCQIPAAPKYFYRVREARADDVIDCDGQHYICEVKLPDLRPAGPDHKVQVDYSRYMLKKLTDEEKGLFFDEISSYLSNLWWREEDGVPNVEEEDGGLYNVDAPVTIFGLAQCVLKSTKVRPVADCRLVNQRMEGASYAGENVSNILTEVSLAANAISETASNDCDIAMSCLDISRAFYRLRLCNSSGCSTRLLLRTCNKWFSCGRLIFGLAIGPGALEAFVMRLLALAEKAGVLEGVYAWAYLDDLTFVGEADKVRRATAYVRTAATLHGLPIPDSKVVHLCSHGSSPSRSRHLGIFWNVVDQKIVAGCPNFGKPDIKDQFTKRQLFSLVGKWFDALRIHPQWRFAADTCRMIAGRWSISWDKPHVLTPEEKKVLTGVFAMVEDGDSDHVHELPMKKGRTIVARCDASTIGYGWLWSLGDPDSSPALCSRARWWKSGQRYWHINRKELFCIVELLLCLSDLSLAKYGISTIRVETDSRVACSWLKGGSFKMVTKSQERVAIGRLLMLATEAQSKMGSVNVSICHIKTDANATADMLSRMGAGIYQSLEMVLTLNKEANNEAIGVKVSKVEVQAEKDLDYSKLRQQQEDDPLLVGLIRRCQKAPDKQVIDNGSVFRLVDRGGSKVLVRLLRTPGIPLDGVREVLVHPVIQNDLEGLIVMYHDRIGHLNDRATRWHISRDWWWPGMRSMIKRVCRGCKQCGDVLLQRPFSVCPDNVLDYPECSQAPWQMVSADLCGPLCISNGYTYCLVLCDHYSRFTIVKGMRTSTAKEFVATLMKVCSTFGFMKELRSDRAGCFSSKYTRESLQRHNVKLHLINPRSPFSNGLVERRMREVKQVFKLYGVRRSKKWIEQLPTVMRRLNNVVLPEPLNTTPFELMFARSFISQPGQEPVVDASGPSNEVCQKQQDDAMITREWVSKMRELREREPSRLRQASVVPGMKVMVHMAKQWSGPFVVKAVLSDRASVIICDKFAVERSEHRANLRPYYGPDSVIAF